MRKMSVALDASVKETPGLNVQDDTDLIAKIKRDIEKNNPGSLVNIKTEP